jgi:hypothetical protein
MAKRYSIFASTLATALVLLVSSGQSLRAQNARAELFGGVGISNADPENPLPKNWMTGWAVSVTGFPNKWFGVGAEFSGQFGTISAPSSVPGAPGLNSKAYSYMVGPQFRFFDRKRVEASFRLLVGGTFGQVTLPASETPQQISALGAAGYGLFNQTKFSAFFAFPVDVGISKHVGIRVEPGIYLTDFNQMGESNFRINIGPVFRFGSHE